MQSDAAFEPVTLTNVPMIQAMQLASLLDPATLPYLPAAQSLHVSALLEPISVLYFPILQVVHRASVGELENLPEAHAVHSLAPAEAPMFVIDPAVHRVHDGAANAANQPALQGVHELAPYP